MESHIVFSQKNDMEKSTNPTGSSALTTRSFFDFMNTVIEELATTGHHRTAETYRSTFRSLKEFTGGNDLLLSDISTLLAQSYESHLRVKGVCRNSSSFYMRIFRATYNRAVRSGFITPAVPAPFAGVYTGVDKTAKRAVTLETISLIRKLDLSASPLLAFARDMFLFSFYMRGMSLVDMAYLRKSDLKDGLIGYYRKKTGRRLFIKMEECMREIVDRYSHPDSPYLLPILSASGEEARRQYLNASHLINHKLKEIGKKVGCDIMLTMYVARHSWASAARLKEIPMSVISEGMGHSSEMITRIYLDSINNTVIDSANRLILDSIS